MLKFRLSPYLLFFAVLLAPAAVNARETRNIRLSGNLDERTPIVGLIPQNPSFADLEAGAQFDVEVDIIDALGVLHTGYIYFLHSSPAGGLGNVWTAILYVDGGDVAQGSAGIPVELIRMFLNFDANRRQAPRTPAVIYVEWSSGGAGIVSVELLNFTNADSRSLLHLKVQDGCQMQCSNSANLDFDGDTRDDALIWRPNIGYWAVRRSSDSGVIWKQWGLPGDYPMPGDYTGDGLADLVVWRPSNGIWFICRSERNLDCSDFARAAQFGLPGDRPLSGDFDGDGVLDFAVWRSVGRLHIYYSSRTEQTVIQQWGLPGDIPGGTKPNR